MAALVAGGLHGVDHLFERATQQRGVAQVDVVVALALEPAVIKPPGIGQVGRQVGSAAVLRRDLGDA